MASGSTRKWWPMLDWRAMRPAPTTASASGHNATARRFGRPLCRGLTNLARLWHAALPRSNNGIDCITMWMNDSGVKFGTMFWWTISSYWDQFRVLSMNAPVASVKVTYTGTLQSSNEPGVVHRLGYQRFHEALDDAESLPPARRSSIGRLLLNGRRGRARCGKRPVARKRANRAGTLYERLPGWI